MVLRKRNEWVKGVGGGRKKQGRREKQIINKVVLVRRIELRKLTN